VKLVLTINETGWRTEWIPALPDNEDARRVYELLDRLAKTLRTCELADSSWPGNWGRVQGRSSKPYDWPHA
jgi:hypothetical protein